MNDPVPNPSLSRRLAIVAILGLLAYANYMVIEPFMVPLAWAAVLVYVSWPLYRRLRRLLQRFRTLSALLMTLLLMTVVVLPVLLTAGLLAEEAGEAYRTFTARLADSTLTLPAILTRIPLAGEWLQEFADRLAGDPALLRAQLADWLKGLSGTLAGIAGGLGRNLIGLGFTLLIVFFLYRDGEDFARQVRLLLGNLLGDRSEGYVRAAGATVTAVMYGLLLTAIVQGLLAGVGYWFVGFQAPILLSAVTMLFALIPFGTPLVWGSLGIWLLVDGQLWQGIALLVWGTVVVSSIDNLIRPLVISSATHVPFLLVLFGVLGGAVAFGFVGLILGPVILAIATAVWREWLADAEPQQSDQTRPG